MLTRKCLWLTMLVSAAVTACNEASTSVPKNVFGRDDREAMTARVYPWSTIGRLDNGCTATLIGPDSVLTAGHCVINEDTGVQFSNLVFRPNYVEGSSFDSARVTHIIADDYARDLWRINDWAILTLDKRLGDQYGYMDIESLDPYKLETTPMTLAGYSGDFRSGQTAGVHRGCSIRRDAGHLLHHDCDMTRGASGSAIFYMNGSRATIVAVNVSEFRRGEQSETRGAWSEEWGNQAVPARKFIHRVSGRTPNDELPVLGSEEHREPWPGDGDFVEGYVSLKLVRVGDDIGVRSAYEPCYANVRRYVTITERSYMFPYGIDVVGTREAMRRLIDEQACTETAYEVVNDDLVRLHSRDDYRATGELTIGARTP